MIVVIKNILKIHMKNLKKHTHTICKSDQLIFRSICHQVTYIAKLLKRKNVILENYRKEALIKNIDNFSKYIDEHYMNSPIGENEK